MTNLHVLLGRGDRAKEILENDIYQEAFTKIKEEITSQWENSPSRDSQGRESLWLMLKLLSKIQQALQTTMETGKLARKELEHRESLARRLTGSVSGFFK